jgi:hypothetical protein
MATKIQVRRDSSTNWTILNPGLSEGEIGFETNTGKFKIGNGSSAWSDLDYFLDSSELTSEISSASASIISYLVDSAPGTLDTLNELAAALADDENFATTVTTAIATKSPLYPSTNAQTGTTYTLVLADDNKFVEMDNSSSNTVTIPLNSSVAFPVGAQVTVITTGTGLTTVSPTSGVTLNYYSPTSNSTARIRARYSAVTLVKRATDTWIAIGNLL